MRISASFFKKFPGEHTRLFIQVHFYSLRSDIVNLMHSTAYENMKIPVEVDEKSFIISLDDIIRAEVDEKSFIISLDDIIRAKVDEKSFIISLSWLYILIIK